METKLIKQNAHEMITFNEDQIDLIKRTIAVGATDDELSLFLHQSKKMGLDPLSRQIYFQKYRDKSGKDRVTIIVSIDGYRLSAARTGEYGGSDDAVFEFNDKEEIIRATVTVYRITQGIRCPFTASARWEEYCPAPPKDFMWNKMPFTMVAKVAEALALRKAFPLELGGAYIKEEMDQALKTSLVDTVTGEVFISPSQKLIEKIQPKEETPIDAILKAFADLGMERSEVEAHLGAKLEVIDLQILRAFYASEKRKHFEEDAI